MSTPGTGLGRPMRGRLLAFVLIGLAIFGMGGLYWAHLRGGFGPSLHVSFVAPSALRLWVGEPVRLSGLQIGEVVDLQLAQDSTIQVQTRIEPAYAKWLRADSKVSIDKESLVGDNFVAISAGSSRSAPIEDGGHLAFAPGDSLDERVQRIAAQAEQTLGAMREFMATLNDPKADLRASLADLHSLLNELHGTRGKLDQDLASVQGTLKHFDGNLDRLDQRLAHIETDGSAALQEYKALASDTRKTVGSVDQLVQTAQPRLDEVLRNSAEATKHLDRAVQAARMHWPFRSSEPDAPPVEPAAAPLP